jgi:hypothetical protein
MEQLKKEIINHKPKMKNKIQLIGDNNTDFDENKLITICVFNSVSIIENYASNFEKIYIDEAHHINKPAIYYEDDEDYDEVNSIEESELYEDSDDESFTEESDLYEGDSDNESFTEESDNESITEDDSEDELVNVKKYTEIIKSFVVYNNSKCKKLTPKFVAKANGLYLHQFKWTKDRLIGSLPKSWNILVGYDKIPKSFKALHFTKGGPYFNKYKNSPGSKYWHFYKNLLLNK